MSDMNSNPHFNKAIWARQHNAGSDKLRENLDRDAATEATLALAYEQRTANLIAWMTANGETPDAGHAKQINTRLGLDGDAS